MGAILKLRSDALGRPILRGYEHYWSVILDLTRDGATFTRRDVALQSNDPLDAAIRDFTLRLLAAGHIAVVGTKGSGVRARDVYRVVRRQSEPPRLRRDGSEAPPTAQQLMWNTMRNLLRSGFTHRELAEFAATDEVSISPKTACAYCKHLVAAGYLHVLEPRGFSTPSRMRLIPSMNTGPKAPRLLRTKALYDPNRLAFLAEAQAEEDPS